MGPRGRPFRLLPRRKDNPWPAARKKKLKYQKEDAAAVTSAPCDTEAADSHQ